MGRNARVAPEGDQDDTHISTDITRRPEAWTNSGYLASSSVEFKEGHPIEVIEEAGDEYVPAQFARQHIETMQQCMEEMQNQQTNHIARIVNKYDEIEQDTGSRLTNFVEELKRRKALMKEHYRNQLMEAHQQLKDNQAIAESLRQKNMNLVMNNCELLKTVDSLEQVKQLHEEEIEKSSLQMEETVGEHARALGKSDDEVKAITEKAIKDRVNLRIKYGSRVTKVLQEEEERRKELMEQKASELEVAREAKEKELQETQLGKEKALEEAEAKRQRDVRALQDEAEKSAEQLKAERDAAFAEKATLAAQEEEAAAQLRNQIREEEAAKRAEALEEQAEELRGQSEAALATMTATAEAKARVAVEAALEAAEAEKAALMAEKQAEIDGLKEMQKAEQDTAQAQQTAMVANIKSDEAAAKADLDKANLKMQELEAKLLDAESSIEEAKSSQLNSAASSRVLANARESDDTGLRTALAKLDIANMQLTKSVERLNKKVTEQEETIASQQVELEAVSSEKGLPPPPKPGSKAAKDLNKEMAVIQRKLTFKESENIAAREAQDKAEATLEAKERELAAMQDELQVARAGGGTLGSSREEALFRQLSSGVAEAQGVQSSRSSEEVRALAAASLDAAGTEDEGKDKVTLQFSLLQQELNRSEDERDKLEEQSRKLQEALDSSRAQEEQWRKQLKEVEEELKIELQHTTDLDSRLAAKMASSCTTDEANAAEDIEAKASAVVAKTRGTVEEERTKLLAQAERQAETIRKEAEEDADRKGEEAAAVLQSANTEGSAQETLGSLQEEHQEAIDKLMEELDSQEVSIAQLQAQLEAEAERLTDEKDRAVEAANAEWAEEKARLVAGEEELKRQLSEKESALAKLREGLQETTEATNLEEEVKGMRVEKDEKEKEVEAEKEREAQVMDLMSKWSVDFKAKNGRDATAADQAASEEMMELQHSKEEIEGKFAELEAVKAKLTERAAEQSGELGRIAAELVRVNAEFESVETGLEQSKREVERLNEEVASLRSAKAEATEKEEEVQKELGVAKSKLAELEAGIAKVKQTATRRGRRTKGGKAAAPRRTGDEVIDTVADLRYELDSAKDAAKGGADADKVKEFKVQLKEKDMLLKKKEKELADALKQSTGAQNKGDQEIRKLETAHKKELEKLRKDLEKKAATGGKGEAKMQRSLQKAEKELEAANTELKELRKLPSTIERMAQELAKVGEIEAGMAALGSKLSESDDKVKALTAEKNEVAELYKKEALMRKRLHNEVEDLKGKIRVYCRCRPMKKNELDMNAKTCVSFPDQYTVSVYDQEKNRTKKWEFDACFAPDSTQDQVFEETERLIQSALDGFNVAIFAYGQTGSGKTFTMCGPSDMPGLAPKSMAKIFELAEQQKATLKVEVSCYMLELYLDDLVDLLLDKKQKAARPQLKITTSKDGVVEVRGATIKPAATFEELYEIFEDGMKSRHVTKTKMNDESSRSHLIFCICCHVENLQSGRVSPGKLSLIDLAGSERLSKTGATGQTAKEAAAINQSLSQLGNVIAALSSGEKVIPYRGSRLTELMRDSLGGNAKTLMFVNISPADYNVDETFQALLYAARVKMITNDASAAKESKELDAAKKQIAKLKAKCHAAGISAESDDEA